MGVGSCLAGLGLWLSVAANASLPPEPVDVIATLFQEGAWRTLSPRSSDRSAITVSRKEVDGLLCARGESIVSGISADALLATAVDVLRARDWTKSVKVTQSEILAREDDVFAYYQYLDIPGWGVIADRYWSLVARASTTDSGERRMTWWSATDDMAQAIDRRVLAEHPRAVRVPELYGMWAFQPVDEGVRARFQNCSDMGGALPRFVQRIAASRAIPDTIRELVDAARRRSAEGTLNPLGTPSMVAPEP